MDEAQAQAARERREAMFADGWSFGGTETYCTEDGTVVRDRDAHFGWHLKLDQMLAQSHEHHHHDE
jgi:hypothetical protein